MRQPDVDSSEVRRIATLVLPGSGLLSVERTPDGVSTPVYRLERGGTTAYLRIAENATDSLAPEALVHKLLHDRGVRVPEIIFYEEVDETIGRSVMVTTEIAGWSIGRGDLGVDKAAVVRAAGRDLAAINQLRVEGFGWVRRDRPAGDRLKAELPTLDEFIRDTLEQDLQRVSGLFTTEEFARIRFVVECGDARSSGPQGALVHGDFDVNHIYHRQDQYTGIIDFGEIRGADKCYDLGHFALHDGEKTPDSLFPALLAGYQEISPISAKDISRIHFWSLMIGIRRLAIAISRPTALDYREFLIERIRAVMKTLSV